MHDLLALLASAEPRLALTFVVPSLLLGVFGALAGLVLARSERLAWVLLALAGVLGSCTVLFPLGASDREIWLVRAAVLLAGAAALAVGIARWLGLGAFRTAIALGALASLVPSLGSEFESDRFALVGACALALLGSGFVRRRAPRAALAGLALAFPIVLSLHAALESVMLPRPDVAPRASVPARAGQRNILLVVLDTVGASHLAPYGYPRVTTPGIDAFVAARGTVYSEFRSASPWTLPAHATFLSGLLPSAHGADHPRDGAEEVSPDKIAPWPATRLRGDVPLLQEQLGERGYRTAAIVANHFYLHHDFGLDRGFDRYDDRPGAWLAGHRPLAQLAGFRPDEGHKVFRRGERITDLAIEWLAGEASGKPFFLMLNYMDAHRPYLPPAPERDAFHPAQPADPLQPPKEMLALLYDRELLALDRAVTRLLRWLEGARLLDTTTVVIVGDHGEAFGEHGAWGHDDFLYEEFLRVPLYVARPGVRRSVVPGAVAGDELYAMLVREAGLELDREPEPRQAMVRPLAEYFHCGARVDYWQPIGIDVDRDLLSWLDGRIKYVVSSRGEVEAFDLDRDPGERQPLVLSPDSRRAAWMRARSWWEAHPPRPADQPKLETETAERLRSVGYLAN